VTAFAAPRSVLFDVFKNECKCMFGEAFDSAYLDMQAPRYLDESDEFLWWSERSGGATTTATAATGRSERAERVARGE